MDESPAGLTEPPGGPRVLLRMVTAWVRRHGARRAGQVGVERATRVVSRLSRVRPCKKLTICGNGDCVKRMPMDGSPDSKPMMAMTPAKRPDGPPAAAELYYQMLRIRLFEERLGELLASGAVGGTTHLCIGQEAVPVGVSSCLDVTDLVVSTHRGHGHLLAKGARADRLLAEIAGRVDGYCKGKGGSQHCAVPEIGHMGSNGITGGGLPIAGGLALALKLRQMQHWKDYKNGAAVICYIGDGAAATGNFHETLNMVALWKLPVVFVVENNNYAMSTPMHRFAACDAIADWAARYVNLNTARSDGNDVYAVREAFLPLLARARAGGGPGLMECYTYRQCGHSRSDPRVYRTREEESVWRECDPLRVLQQKAALGTSEIADLYSRAQHEIDDAARFAMASPAGNLQLALSDLDDPADRGSEPRVPAAAREMTLTEAIRETLSAEMQRDENIILIGEDIGKYGGAFGVTRGLLERFGESRVIETPISENSFVGMSAGAAMAGARPVAELMFGDFVTCCMDALVNHAAKIRYMYAGQVRVPMTLRIPVGRRNGYGATHSQSLESLFLHIPGLRVVFPSCPADAAGLLRTAIRSDSPVLFFEHKLLYPVAGPVPEGDYTIPLGLARVAREGSDMTIVSYGHVVGLCLEAAELLAGRGVSAEVIDLRTLAPYDRATCLESIQKTGRLLFAQEAVATGGVCDRVIADLLPDIYKHLRAPVLRVGAADCPIPSSPALENCIMPSVRGILGAALSLLT